MSGKPAPGQWLGQIDLLAWEVHYVDHLAPIWHAIPPARRGAFYTQPALVEHAAKRGVQPAPYDHGLPGLGPLVVASYQDLKRAWVNGQARPLVLSEHGAGFQFGGKNPSYAGGRGLREQVGLFLCVNEYVRGANYRTYPGTPAAVVGCPKLDAWHAKPAKPRGDPPVIAVGFHWNSSVAPETRSAWEHFQGALPALAHRYQVLGHGHPRALPQLAREYERLGIEVVWDFEEVMKRADLYLNDASSTLYEFASLGRPVVVLNAPWYRREVKFGLRFWDHSDVGVQCDRPEDLLDAIEAALADPPEQRERRRQAVEAAYPVRGDSASLAVAAILGIGQRLQAAPSAKAARPAASGPPQAPPQPTRRGNGRAPRIAIVCVNLRDDRIIPRMARALHERLGWALDATPDPAADVIYLSVYFEAQRLKPWPDKPLAAYFTHREEEPPGNAKARLFDGVASKVQLRIATCQLYAGLLGHHGPTARCAAPVERERFILAPREPGLRPVVGFAGYTYANHRKGEDLVRGLVDSDVGRRVEWRASGRGWPVPTRGYPWPEMPQFYQGLDVLVVPSRVEGIPMPPLEALACGVRVVVPRGVGLLDELPDTPGIYRYQRGDLETLLAAVEEAAFPPEPVDREALRSVTAPYSVEAWCADHATAFAEAFGIGSTEVITPASKVPARRAGKPGQRGIYCVAFGEPARASALKLMRSVKLHMPDVPICLCAAEPIGPEDLFVQQPDSDVGGRRSKLRAYELAPAKWKTILYLDADVELVAPVYQLFEWVEDGWDWVMCTDISPQHTLHSVARRYDHEEANATLEAIGTWDALQLNGGVFACARNDRVSRFFGRWRVEWERWAQRDQGAFIRALYSEPIKVFVLGNEWNSFPRHMLGSEATTAGILHYPGDARRWEGLIPARLDSDQAWYAVKEFERQGAR